MNGVGFKLTLILYICHAMVGASNYKWLFWHSKVSFILGFSKGLMFRFF